MHDRAFPITFGGSSPQWAGKDDVLYSVDDQRGIDILRWTGEHYVPDAARRVRPERGRKS